MASGNIPEDDKQYIDEATGKPIVYADNVPELLRDRTPLTDEETRQAKILNRLSPLERVKQGALAWNFWVRAYADSWLRESEDSELIFVEVRPEILADDPTQVIDFRASRPGGYNLNERLEFVGAIFPGHVILTSAIFQHYLNFRNCEFFGMASFNSAQFRAGCTFEGAIFHAHASFAHAEFRSGRTSSFAGVDFRQTSSFCKAEFKDLVRFSEAKFQDSTEFESARFFEDCDFQQSEFGCEADFVKTEFHDTAEFSETKFRGFVNFGGARFSRSFKLLASRFYGKASFVNTKFDGQVELDNAAFGVVPEDGAVRDPEIVPNFIGARFEEPPNLSFTKIPAPPRPKSSGVISSIRRFWCGPTENERVGDKRAAAKFRRLQTLALLSHNHQAEKRFFREELICRLGYETRSCREVTMINLFELFSECGLSFRKPMYWLLGLIILCGVFYAGQISWSVAEMNADGEAWFDLASYSVLNSLPLIGYASDTYGVAVNTLFGGIENVPWPAKVVAFIQNIASAILLFFALLAIRNYFKLG